MKAAFGQLLDVLFHRWTKELCIFKKLGVGFLDRILLKRCSTTSVSKDASRT